MPYNFSYIIPGKLAGMAMPGSMAPLKGDLQEIKKQGIDAVVTLTEFPLPEESLKGFELNYLHLPIADFNAPTIEQVENFIDYVNECNSKNQAVVVHCAAGIGRTGTMLASYLVSLGLPAEEAISSLRSLRPGSIETDEQEEVVREYSRLLNK